MGIGFEKENRIFTLQTDHTTYQFQVDAYGFLLHLYYGKTIYGGMDYLLTYYDRGFSANPYDADQDRTYSMDALPQEFPTSGTGDFRSPALTIKTAMVLTAAICGIKAIGSQKANMAFRGSRRSMRLRTRRRRWKF